MRQMTMEHVWIEGERVDWAERVEGLANRLWKYGWGLLFVVAMTVLSEYGPRTVYSKVADRPLVVSAPAVHSVK